MGLSLDDLWRDGPAPGGRCDPHRTRRLYRVAVVGAVGASYLVDTLLLSLFYLTGTVDPRVPAIYGCLALGHVALFAALHWSGVSERFANPHMTVWQMAYGIALLLLSIAIAEQIATFFLALIFVVFGFGTLRISPREALTVWLFACLAVAATLAASGHRSLGIASASKAELALVGISFATILLRTIALGYYATALRIRALDRTRLLEQAVDEAEHRATHDALTGIFNRRVILPAIDDLIGLRQRKGIPACIAMLDIDRFKLVNDRLGHLAGDAVLQRLARHIAGSIRKSDKLGRYGGEEFILLLPATDLEHAAPLVERIRAEIAAASWGASADCPPITVSCGVTDIRPGDMAVDAVTRADRALYRAKTAGRNRVCRAESAP